MKLPLAMIVLWHPEFSDGQEYSNLIFSEFNRKIEDPLSRGINIPIFFRHQVPLIPIPYDTYKFIVVVALIDKNFVLGGKYGDNFSDYLKEVISSKSQHPLVIPVAVDKSAFSLDINYLNFVRLYEHENKKDYLINVISHETTRHLYDVKSAPREGSPPPLRLFISHSKGDGVKIAKQIKSYVDLSSSLQTFFDANDIAIGYDFSKEIEKYIQDTVLIAIHTDSYSSREWCRREILLAKENNRPIVVLNCFKNGESRSFPYMANVLTIHFDCINESVLPTLLTAVMKETLRLKYQELLIECIAKEAGIADISASISAYPPELVTVLKKRNRLNNLFIYPDPPIGTEELSIIKELDPDIKFITPSELYVYRMGAKIVENGKAIGISISESDEMEKLGLSRLHLQNEMVEIARYLLSKGYNLAYGGDLNYDSQFNFLEILFQLAMTYGGSPSARIINYSAFPLYTKISAAREAEIKRVAKIIRVNPSNEFDEWTEVRYESASEEQRQYLNKLFDPKDAEAKEIWSRSLTKMRETMANDISARIVLGGKISNFLGKMPGVVEEATICINNGITLFVNSTFGGASSILLEEDLFKEKLVPTSNNKITVYRGTEEFADIENFMLASAY
ncbi:TIR domain-containing protein [Ohtaekwangia kribbensis]|uniref:TIR domain-containing protein n=1 Tax=Ohtaekwangia kribbensis TaxID=688913 RepID=A0ABW3K199_9BACT